MGKGDLIPGEATALSSSFINRMSHLPLFTLITKPLGLTSGVKGNGMQA